MDNESPGKRPETSAGRRPERGAISAMAKGWYFAPLYVLLCLLLLAMILLACVQIGLRLVGNGGYVWAEPLLRQLVLWSGMFGAVVATMRGKHIHIDLVSHFLPERFRPWLGLLLDLFSSLVTLALAWAGVIFIRNEFEFGGASLLGVPSWVWNLVFPVAFACMSMAFAASAVGRIKERGRPGTEGSPERFS